MLTPPQLVADLEKVSSRYATLQQFFADFAQDAKAFFEENKTVKGLAFHPQASAKDQITAFDVAFAGRAFRFEFAMDKAQGVVTVLDATDEENRDRVSTCNFNGQGETQLKSPKGDSLTIVGGEGRHLFLHLLHESTKSLRS